VTLTLPDSLRSSPATRVALGLVGLMVSLILLSDLFVGGFLPDRTADARRQRIALAQLIGTEVTHALRNDDDAELRAMLNVSVRHDEKLLSAAVFADDQLRAVAGDHTRSWKLGPGEPSTYDNLRLPLLSEGRHWGELQLAFAPVEASSLLAWLQGPVVMGVALIAGLGFVSFQLYLRRAMRYLDPSAAVPERVRTAFDALAEGVLVLDTDGRIMLTNRAFLSLGGPDTAVPTGALASDLTWLSEGLATIAAPRPWPRVIQTRQAVLGIELRLGHGTGYRDVVMNCSPINDGFGRARGCLVTFSDVTELHERTEGLRSALAELRVSREEIRLKNDELTLLATRDPLTGCLNRRAFLEECERLIEAASRDGTALCCVMCDVDHFKAVNDRFGHGGGDEVLKAVSKTLARGLRVGDVLGRYGGEEFCIVLKDADLEQAMQITERLRAAIEANAGSAVRHLADVKVTMSFGVERFGTQAKDFAGLVDLADQALYHSKKTGRNRVTTWAADLNKSESVA
jgi:diguanylate cyclase (GGDEF)-like protein